MSNRRHEHATAIEQVSQGQLKIARLLQKVGRRTATNVVAVVGRSGSGKSSIVYAGLLPALRREKGLGDRGRVLEGNGNLLLGSEEAGLTARASATANGPAGRLEMLPEMLENKHSRPEMAPGLPFLPNALRRRIRTTFAGRLQAGPTPRRSRKSRASAI